jgi:hypothetical protein
MRDASMGSVSSAWRALSRGDNSCSASAAPLLQVEQDTGHNAMCQM